MRSISETLAVGLSGIAFLGLAVAAPSAEAAQLYPYYLTKGQDYALEAQGWCDGSTVELINPVGVTTIALSACIEPDDGQEFRAAYTGTFQVRVTDGPEGGVGFGLSKDCRQDAKTLCTFRSGTTNNGSFSWADDDDWFRLSLVRGRTYAFTYRPAPGWYVNALLTLRNAAGKSLVTTGQIDQGTLTFQAKATGTYFLDVYNMDLDRGGAYLLHMTER